MSKLIKKCNLDLVKIRKHCNVGLEIIVNFIVLPEEQDFRFAGKEY